MKRILALILALVMCLSSVALLASCKDETEQPSDGGAAVTYDVAKAKDYLKSLYTKYLTNNKTNGDFELITQVKLGEATYTVTWVSDNEQVKIVPIENEAKVTVDIPEKPEVDVNYKLTATISAPDGTSTTFELSFVVPLYDEDAGFADYIAAKKDDAVIVEGIVTSISSKSEGDNYNNLYLQDLKGHGGYYIYSIKDGKDPVKDLGIKLGMTVSVAGIKDIYNGTHEVKDAVVTVTDTTEKTVDFIDITDKVLAAADAKAEALVNYQGCWVTVKGVEITGQEESNYYYKWVLGNVDTYTRLSLSSGLESSVLDEIKEGHTAHKGYSADVKGIVNVYNGTFYLVPLGADAFVYGEKVELTDAAKVEREKEALTLKEEYATNVELILPVVGPTYTDVTIAWTSSDASILAIAANGAVTYGAAGEVTLTATLTAGEVTDTKTFTVTVKAGTTLNAVKPEVGTDYRLGFIQLNENKIYYLTGTEGGYNNYYTATSTNWDEAAVFGIEATEGGYYLFCTVGGAKKYLNMVVSGSHVNPKFQDTAATVYTYDEELKTFVATLTVEEADAEYVFATYGSYTNPGPTETSKTGSYYVYFVTQAGTVVEPDDDDNNDDNNDDNTNADGKLWTLTKPEVGTAYKFGMFQGKANKYVYLTGAMNGYYAASTETYTDGADFYIEATEGGYYIYWEKDGVKTYLNMVASGNYVNPAFGDTASTVYTWNETLKTFVSTVNGKEYAFGTRSDKTYLTAGPCDTSYTTNFWCGFVAFVEPEADPEADTPLTFEEATEVALNRNSDEYTENKYVITGTIVSIDSATYGNLTIADAAGNTFVIYGTYYPYYDAANRWDKLTDEQKPGVGDVVSFYGVIGHHGGSAQMKNGVILDGWVRHDCMANLELATCTKPATCTLCGAEYGAVAAHNYGEDAKCVDCGWIRHYCEDNLVPADCENPETCSVCKATFAEALGHNYGEDDICINCGETKPYELVFDFVNAGLTDMGAEKKTADALKELFDKASTSDTSVYTVTGTPSKVYSGNGSGGGDAANNPNLLKMGTGSANGSFDLTFTDKNIFKVVINGRGWSATDKLSVNGVEQTPGATATDVTFELETASDTITIKSTKRVVIYSITVYYYN